MVAVWSEQMLSRVWTRRASLAQGVRTPEFGKMLRGEWYVSDDSELVELRCRANKICLEFNQTPVADAGQRRRLLQALLDTQEVPVMDPPIFFDYGITSTFGEGVEVGEGLVVLDVGPVRVGRNTRIGRNVQLLGAGHPLDAERRSSGIENGGAITIGENCTIEDGAIVVMGATVGDNSIVKAGSVVVKNIPRNSIAAGNPARVVGHIP